VVKWSGSPFSRKTVTNATLAGLVKKLRQAHHDRDWRITAHS
jgi:hypothetical protein